MSWRSAYLALPSGIFALLLVAAGTAALRTGRLLPPQRRYVQRVELFGRAQLVMAGAFAVLTVPALLDDPALRSGVGTLGFAGIFCALVLVVRAQLPRRDR
ncbi:hypothetical protein GTY86_09825 [Streptomyces sp. SID5770]|uniref:hypothetical protein n=1 Tax=Streptomyces sp. SID5770 TaxID=2690308 RepID=UPI00136B2152|nr:hypothetical protein [Streptomyces sp. SID5770]MZE51607.1 hypothetical protein [Streptomyces sp. SID5770]